MAAPDESGVVTAEYAVTLPAILGVLSLIITGMLYLSAHANACHGARLYAREISIGASPTTAQSIAQAGTPTSIDIGFFVSGSTVQVTARSDHFFRGLPAPTCTVKTLVENHVLADVQP